MVEAKRPGANPVKRWKPAPAEWIRVFGEAVGDLPDAEQRKMFGYPAAFVRGNMFAGLHESGLVLRLPDSEREKLLKRVGAKPFEPMPGRPMREYVVAPDDFVAQPAQVKAWLRKAFEYGSSLPPKAGSRKKPQAR